MGNRAVVSFSTAANAPSLYLHWNGGLASIEGFLSAAIKLGYQDAGSQSRDIDQLEEVIRPFFAENSRCLSIYRQKVCQADCDNYDNGWYIVDPRTLQIRDRRYMRYPEEVDGKKTGEIERIVVKLNTVPRCRYEYLWEKCDG